MPHPPIYADKLPALHLDLENCIYGAIRYFPCIPSGKWSGAMTGGFKEVMKPSRPSDLRYLLIWLWQARRDD